MEQQVVINAITSLGFPAIACYFLWKQNEKNIIATNLRIDKLEVKNDKLELERLTDKEMLKEMMANNTKLTETNNKINDKLQKELDDVSIKVKSIDKKIDDIKK